MPMVCLSGFRNVFKSILKEAAKVHIPLENQLLANGFLKEHTNGAVFLVFRNLTIGQNMVLQKKRPGLYLLQRQINRIMKAVTSTILWLAIFSSTLFGQTCLAGKIVDAESGEELIAANITLFPNGVLIARVASDCN
jgi:hypothetical protein